MKITSYVHVFLCIIHNISCIVLRRIENGKVSARFHFSKNNDQGWKKRWMVFDGEMLRYFTNNKVSLQPSNSFKKLP